MTKKTDNPDSTSKSISERLNDLLPNFRKLFNSTAAAVLLLPNIMSVGVVAAEEPTSGEEPPVGEFSDASDETQTTPDDTHITGTTADLETTNLQATPQEETPTEPVAAEAAEESVAPAQIIEDEFYPIGFEVRGLDGTRTNDVRIYVQDENFTVYTGSFNEYGQWQSDEALPVGEYTVTLVTPQNTYAVVSDAANNAATPTEKTNVFTFSVNEESRGNLSRVYGSFRLVERSYRLGVEVRGLDGRRTDDVTVWVQNEDFTVFEGSYNEYGQWLTNAELTAGQYTITLDTPDNTYAVINPTTPQYAVPTDEENIFTIELNEANLGTSSAIYGAFQLEEFTSPIGVEVRGLDGRRTNDVTVWVQNDNLTVFEGSFNEYNQWKTETALPVGQYTITLVTPENTYAVINPTAQQYAVPTDEQNVFTIEVNEANLGTSSAIYGAFQLEEMGFTLGVEVRGLNGRRTTDVDVTITPVGSDEEVFSGSFNEYGQWLTDAELPAGDYTITLDTPRGTAAVLNETTAQYAMPTDEQNVFTITLNEENLGTSSAIYGAFQLIEAYPLGLEIRGLDGRRTQDVPVWVQDENFAVVEGSFNEYGQWHSVEALPVGTYTVTLDTPDNTYAVLSETGINHAEATEDQNVFTIDVHGDVEGNLSRVYGAFQLEEMGFTLGVEVRGLDGRRTNDVTVWVQDDDFTVFEGSFNEYNQWKTEAELPAGEYTITLVTPENTYAVINDTTAQYAVPTDEENVFTIVLNEENLGTSSAIYGAFQLVEFTSPIGVEVRGLDDRRTNEVDITLTDAEGNILEGSYDEWNLWTSTDALPVGTYTLTLETPEGTVALVNEDVDGQVAEATGTPNVFTITVNEANRGALLRVFGAFILEEVEEDIDIDDLLERIEELERRLDELETANAELEAELARLRAQLAELQADQAAAEERIAELERRIAELEARLAELENQEEPEEPEAPIEDDDNDEEPTDPAEPALPGDNGDDDDDDSEDPATPATPVDEQDDDEDDLPETGIAPSTIGLGITTLLSGLGLAFIEKKRRK